MTKWAKGQSGNPKGRRTEKPFRDALKLALSEEDETTKRTKLRVIADNLVTCAMKSEPWAIKEVMDRYDGKPVQQVDATVTERRDVIDYTREELIEIINEGDGSQGVAEANGCSGGTDKLH